MEDFTYEVEDRTLELETYEWDNVWWEQAPDTAKPRALYIGDSISCGIRRIATEKAGGRILFDGFGTSKAVDNPYFAQSLRLFRQQQPKREIVILNNGLHGFHLSDTDQYKTHYEKLVKFLLEEFRDAPLALVLTTDIDDHRRERVIARNSAVEEIAKRYGLPVIDLYSVSVEYAGLRSGDGIHYTQEGYEKLAEKLLESVYQILPAIR